MEQAYNYNLYTEVKVMLNYTILSTMILAECNKKHVFCLVNCQEKVLE